MCIHPGDYNDDSIAPPYDENGDLIEGFDPAKPEDALEEGPKAARGFLESAKDYWNRIVKQAQ